MRTAIAKPPRLCVLVDPADRIEECPKDGCPFWEPGGAVLDASCALERMQPRDDWTPDLAQRWLILRGRLAAAGGR